MIPLSLRLRRVRSWQELDLDLPEGVTALTGPNGAGKSTVVNAIEAALFGPESRSFADWYPRVGGSYEMQIEFAFDHNGDRYRVRRSFSPKGRGSSKMELEQFSHSEDDGLTRIGGPGIEVSPLSEVWASLTLESQQATQDRLEAMLGLSRDSFRASSFLAQGEAGRFCEAAPRDRKQILADIIGLHQWDEWLEQARAAKREAEMELRTLSVRLADAATELDARPTLESRLAGLQQQSASYDERIAAAAAETDRLRGVFDEQQRTRDALAAAKREIDRITDDLDESAAAIASREREIGALLTAAEKRSLFVQLAEALPALEEEQERLRVAEQQVHERRRATDSMSALDDEILTLAHQAEAMEARAILVLDDATQHSCDRCGQTLNDEAAERAAASYRQEAQALAGQIRAKQEQADTFAARLLALKDAEWDADRADQIGVALVEARNAKSELAALNQADRRLAVAREELADLRAGRERRQADLGAAQAALDSVGPQPDQRQVTQVDIQRAHTEVGQLRRDRDSVVAGVARAQEQIDRLDKIAADMAADIVSRDDAEKDSDLYAALERACGPNGVPALILESQAIPQVETEANRILSLLGGPAYAVELRTLREKKTGGLADTLDIVLLTEAGEADYRSFSGGERARVAFALRLALAQLLASRHGSRSGLLVIDEIDGLDGQGVAALVEVLDELQQHVPTILVVSHQPELRDAFDHSLTLERGEDGWSRIANGTP